MANRPILLNGAMVRATLDGRKTQTRRVMRPQPDEGAEWASKGFDPPCALHLDHWGNPIGTHSCPYGVPGDRLYVKETFCLVDDTEFGGERWVDYRATPRYSADRPAGWENAPDDAEALKWRPSIHMPRWASRITLEVTEVRVQRLQDISEEDAVAEGVDPAGHLSCEVCSRSALLCPASASSLVMDFAALWDSINGKRPGCSWADNPYVWAISFKPVEVRRG